MTRQMFGTISVARARINSSHRTRAVHEFCYTASLATSVVGKNPPDWCDQSDA